MYIYIYVEREREGIWNFRTISFCVSCVRCRRNPSSVRRFDRASAVVVRRPYLRFLVRRLSSDGITI